MNVNLPVKSFSFFKITVGFLFLVSALFSPLIAGASFVLALTVGKAHSIGAWLAMWRAGKLNWTYVVWMFVVSGAVAFWGLKLTSFSTLVFVTGVLFLLHFIYDEVELQEQKKEVNSLISSFSPFILGLLFIFNSYLGLGIEFMTFMAIFTVLLLIEMINLRELNWFFVDTKILSLFILCAIPLKLTSTSILGIFLIFHYFFWFIYPIYKLHKYKREERDGFIMMLLLVIASALFFAATRHSYGDEIWLFAVKTFMVGTIIHILATAPFGYLFGLPKPKVYSSA